MFFDKHIRRPINRNGSRPNTQTYHTPRRPSSIWDNYQAESGFTDVDILIAAHKPFNCPVHNECYKIITDVNTNVGNQFLEIIRDDGTATLSNLSHSMSELSKYAFFAEKCTPRKYVATCHYRRYFSFYDNIPDLDKLFEEHDAVIHFDFPPNNGILRQCRTSHNPDNFVEYFHITPDVFPEYTSEECEQALNGPWISNRNMMILRSEDFLKWVDFYTRVSLKFNEIHNIHNDNDTREYVRKTINKFPVRNVDYQARLHGFIIERLTTLFINHNFKNPLTVR